MIQLFAFRRTLVACVIAVFSIVFFASANPADARPRHHRGHHAFSHDHRHHITSKRSARKHANARRHSSARKYGGVRRHHMRRARIEMRYENRRAARLQKFFNANAALMPPSAMLPQDGVSMQTNQATAALTSHAAMMSNSSMTSGATIGKRSASSIVAEARRYIGGNPTGRKSLWCARFMNMVLQRSGHRTTGSDMARSFASYGQRISGPQVGAIAVMSRGKRGGHVGIVSGVDTKGDPIVVSGNHGHRVAESVYSRSRIYAYVIPN